jgi:hypothetical protein
MLSIKYRSTIEPRATTTTSTTNEQSQMTQNVEENEDVLASLKDFLCTEEKNGSKDFV